jgi:hypothetical protein
VGYDESPAESDWTNLEAFVEIVRASLNGFEDFDIAFGKTGWNLAPSPLLIPPLVGVILIQRILRRVLLDMFREHFLARTRQEVAHGRLASGV